MTDKLKSRIISVSIIALCAIMLIFCAGCDKKAANEPTGNIVFLGDSITESYDLEYYFPDIPILNSGVWGDRTDQAQERLESDVYAHNPKKTFILLGINDVGCGRTNNDISDRIKDIIKDIQKNCPEAKLYLISVYPLNISDFDTWYPPMSEDINDIVDDLNAKLITLADKMNVEFIDIAPHLKNENNELKKEYTVEGLHLTQEAYEVISGVLDGYLN